MIADWFMIFNTSGDGSMNMQEFSECYEKWIKKVTIMKKKIMRMTILKLPRL